MTLTSFAIPLQSDAVALLAVLVFVPGVSLFGMMIQGKLRTAASLLFPKRFPPAKPQAGTKLVADANADSASEGEGDRSGGLLSTADAHGPLAFVTNEVSPSEGALDSPVPGKRRSPDRFSALQRSSVRDVQVQLPGELGVGGQASAAPQQIGGES